MIIEMTKQQICNELGITKNNLKMIEQRGQLYDRLINKGYKLIEKEKVGRSVIYKIETCENNILNLYSNTIEYVLGVNPKKQDEFAKYFKYRDQNIDKPITKKMLSNLVGVDRHLIGKWDDNMVKNKLLLKDGFWYIAVDYEKDEKGNIVGATYRTTDKIEFNSFMKDKRITKTIEGAKIKLIENKITWDEYDAIIAGISVHLAMIENKYVFRINKFIINDKNELYEQLKFMIQELTPKGSFKLSFDGLI